MQRSSLTHPFIKSIILLVAAFSLLTAGPVFVHAQAGQVGESDPGGAGQVGESDGGGNTLINPLKFNTLDELINAVLAAVIRLGEIILVFMLIFTGFKFVEARGKEEELSKAKKALLWTIVGGLILLGATAIKTVIQATVMSVTP